ncbi:MAG TPA: cyclic nucleotide-binding protein [Micromonosporaceae bacterium]|nr:cyclic nucleotide-binding protein [Micromonosporaceae bacterium]
MAFVETRLSLWEALAGRAPGQPAGPADPGLWAAVVDRLNPARARPQLRPGIEEARLTSVRGVPYTMLKSPDGDGRACYLRLTPEEAQLALLMDGSRTVARLVAEFVRLSGRLAPDQVTRVVADLAGNRMLEELPVDAFGPLERVQRRPWPVRLGRGLLAAARGQRMVVANIDPLVTAAYRAGGRFLFTRAAAGVMALVALAGLAVFGWSWWLGDPSVFLTNGSYAMGALVLLGFNIIALGCHELGHALAAKHAGRRVPAAGFLVYFGIPSVFVDTTDVWMAGRRARLLTTAAGPAAGLVLAGVAQLVGLAVPELAPWMFKLSFAWYVNALFNLNPFLALDGYYLLMDWVEVPNLRARGMAWVSQRLRRRPPRWSQLDREGRLVALYGVLAVLWLAIAVNIAYRVYADRVSGLVTGLWRTGWPGRLLLAAVVAGLAAPVVYAVTGWLSRRWRALRRRVAARRDELDLPHRMRALRGSALGGLPVPVLASLAASASWLHPRTGSPLVFAGAAQSSVFVVVDGALEGRRPGDPSGLVRERVGPGGVVGLASALTGAPSSLAWHTAGTTLLALPAPAVTAAVGPLPGPNLVDRAEVEELLDLTTAFAGLSDEDRLGLVSGAKLLVLSPGDPVELVRPEDALIISSGYVTLGDGSELRRGTLVGPVGEALAGPVATARTPARAWLLPAVSGLPLLVGGAAAGPGRAGGVAGGAGPAGGAAGWAGGAPGPVGASGRDGRRPAAGAHPVAAYPPLAAPPGPPPPGIDDSTDRRFERALRWLVVLVLLLALLLTGANLLPGPAWAEMRADQALLRVSWGSAAAVIDGEQARLASGDRVYVSAGDSVSVPGRSRAELVFRGGSTAILCAGSSVGMGPLSADGFRPAEPAASLSLVDGRLLADTASTTSAFEALELNVGSAGRTVVNYGEAWFGVAGGGAEVSVGEVAVDGTIVPPSRAPLSCGDGVPVSRPAGSDQPDQPTGTPSRAPSASSGSSLSPSGRASPSPGAPTGSSPLPGGSTTQPPPFTPWSPPPPQDDTVAPVVSDVRVGPSPLAQTPPEGSFCEGGSAQETVATVYAQVHDATDPPSSLVVWFTWYLDATGASGQGMMSSTDGVFRGQFSVPWTAGQEEGGMVAVTVSARDATGNAAEQMVTWIALDPCWPSQVEKTPILR